MTRFIQRVAAAVAATCFLASALHSQACTIVSGVDTDGITWAGNNEDMFFHFETSLKVLPRSEGRLGAFIVTYNDGFPQGGVNEKGLFFDFNALSPVGIENYRNWDNKLDIPAGVNIIIEMLQRYDSVHDALEYLDQFRSLEMLAAQIHIADAQGNLAVFSGEGICYKKRYQVSTNFRVCVGDIDNSLAADPKGRWRYPVADATLKSGVDFSSIKTTLSKTARKKYVSTIYSFITDLDTTETHLYYGGDFNHSYDFNVKEIADQGASSILMRDLFPDAPLVKLWQAYKYNGVEAALNYFRTETTHMDAFARRELLRHLYTNLLLDIDPKSLDISAAQVLFDEWMKGEGNGTELYYQGIFALANGDTEKARTIYKSMVSDADNSRNSQLAQQVIDRLDGKAVSNANVHVELEGHGDAQFVYVNGLSKSTQFFDFMTPTETGWVGDFNALYPDANYQIVVDGIVVKRRGE